MPDLTDDERRRRHRERRLQRARIVLGSGFTAIDCVVLDLSEGGAKLGVTNGFVLPPRFQLRLDDRHLDVEICHRTGRSVGVRFAPG